MAEKFIVNGANVKLEDNTKYLTAFNRFPYNGLKFDGIANYCSVYYGGGFINEFTLLVYIKNLLLTAQGTIFRATVGGGNAGFYFEFTGNNIIIYYFPAPLYQITIPVNTLNLNFFGVSVSNTDYTVNINGVNTVYPKASVPVNFHTFDVGGRGTGLNTTSIIYDFKIMNYAMSQSELTDFYNRGSLQLNVLSNRIADWAFEERSGYTAFDSSSNNNHLALLNFTVPQISLGVDNNHVDYKGDPIQ